MMPELPNTEEKARLTPALVTLGLRTLSSRAYAYIALLMTAAAFAFVIYDPTILRLVGVGGWAAFILISGATKGGPK